MTKVAPHKHCIVCGRAVEPDDSFCDELCQSKYESTQKRQKMLFVAFMILIILIIVLPLFTGSPKG